MKKSMMAIAALAAATAGVNAADTVLWPGDQNAKMYAQDDSKLTLASWGGATVETGTKAPWPGMRLDFVPERDFSAFGWIKIAVTNLNDKPVEVCLSVKSRAMQGQSPGGNVRLAPHAGGEIIARMDAIPWVLDGPVPMVGMNGCPGCLGRAKGPSVFDVTHTSSFHIFRGGAPEKAHYAVTGVTCGGASQKRTLLPAKDFMPFVDIYGQFRHGDWPGKIHNAAELEKTRIDEKAYLENNAASPIPGADRFGGWGEGPLLKATGFFRTEKVNGKWWLVDPDGRLFFSHGVDCVNHGEGLTGIGYRENYFKDLPPKNDPAFGGFWGVARWKAAHGFYAESNHYPYAVYNIGAANCLRKYGADWRKITADLAHRRIRSWGLNTIANWSQSDVYYMRRTPYTICLGTGGTPRRKGSKGWWGPLPDPFVPEFERTLRERAKNVAKEMKNDPWCVGVFVDNELAWNDLPDLEDVALKYFEVVSRVIREELPNHLYLGCRIAWGPECVYRAASKYCDVVSVNIYSRLPIRDLPAGSVDKPMIIGEFHFGALDRGMFHTGLVATSSQNERAQCYRDYVNACLDHPRFVGSHWFQWKDQPLTGRSDGENYQIGFLTITDTPYPELVNASRDVAAKMYRRRFRKSE